MGYMRHHVIIVTSWNLQQIVEARETALDMFNIHQVSQLIYSPVNNYNTFIVAPDGSKEGWEDSDKGDDQRDIFIKWLNKQRYEDGSSSLDWAEVQYGDENGDARVLRHDALDETPHNES